MSPPRPASVLVDGWRFATGLLCAIPVTPPTRVDRPVARAAMVLAPIGALPLALWWFAWGAVAHLLQAPPLVAGAVAVVGIVLATRAMHLDGLADVADALSASYDRERALAVMKTGDVGPSGAGAIVLALLLQAAAAAELSQSWAGLALGTLAVLISRWVLALATADGVPSARPTGLGTTVAGSVPVLAVALGGLVLSVLGALGCAIAGGAWWVAPLLVLAAAAVTAVLVRRAVQRFGGITGDVLGAAVEISLAAALTLAALLA